MNNDILASSGLNGAVAARAGSLYTPWLLTEEADAATASPDAAASSPAASTAAEIAPLPSQAAAGESGADAVAAPEAAVAAASDEGETTSAGPEGEAPSSTPVEFVAMADLPMAFSPADSGSADAGAYMATTAGCACSLCGRFSDGIREVSVEDANPAADIVGAPGAPGTLQTLANYLRVGFWNDFLGGASQRYYNVDDNGTGANFGVLYYNVTWSPDDADGISAARATLVREAFKIYEAVLNIDFIETTSTTTAVDFFFGDNVAGQAYAYSNMYSGNSGVIDNTVINVASGWNGGSSTIGSYTFQTFIHEIGHGLGLGHQGDYNAGAGSPTYANSAQWENDSWALTMMSYWDQVENTSASTLNFSYAQLVSPMTVDWIALNDLYAGQDYVGRSFGTDQAFTGNTVWGFGTNISSATSAAYNDLAGFADTNAFTIVDGGGTDTIDFSNYAANQVINLNAATAGATNANFSSVGGLTGNMSIAVGTIIENAYGGSGNDTLTGNSANNRLEGRGGNDSLIGNDGNDTLDGGTGADNLNGGFGDDLYIVDNVGDVAGEVAGGIDTVQSSVTFTLSVNLENLTLTGSADITGIGNDSRANVLIGNSGANILSGGFLNDTLNGGTGEDTLLGGDDDDVLAGESGVDSINGGAGNDLILFTSGHFYDNVDGGAGSDTLDASAVSRNGDTFDFEAGIISGYPGGQTVTGIEVFLGGAGDETIISDGNGNSYYGNGGNDYMVAELGNETMDGGVGGTDTIDLTRWNGPYTIDMTNGQPVQWPGELYTNFENLISGNGDDSITGTSGSNVISTTGGNDSINAGAGSDTVNAGDGDDVITDTQAMGASDDDVYDGGAGTDTLVHDLSWVNSVSFDLTTGFSSYLGNRDQLISIENLTVGGSASVRGSAVANVLIVNGTGANVIDGEAGNDTIDAGGGNDTINAGSGNDSVTAGDGDDIITDNQGMGASDDDVYDGGAGTDTLVHDLNWVSSVSFDLTAGFSSYLGNRDQLISIENLTVGGSASVRGSAVANVLIVNGTGANVIDGEAGNDTINADGGNDTINAGAGNDSVIAGDGDDIITDTQTMLASEDDVYNGGNGIDTLVHDLNWVSSVTFDLNAGFASFGGNRDQLISIENLTVGGSATVIGSAVANVLTVNGNGANIINGLGGNDTITGHGGIDTIDGGDGNDLIVFTAGDLYDNANGGTGSDTLDASATNVSGVTFDFQAGTISGYSGVQTLASIELFLGGSGNETIVSDGNSNRYYGNGGNDYMIAGLGDETMDGGVGGTDTIDLTLWNGPYTIDMANGLPVQWPGELYTNFENLISGNGNDSITGTADANGISTTGGNDTIVSGAGDDTLNGGTGDDSMVGGADNDTYYVDSVGDAVRESLNAGIDTVYTGLASYILSQHVDNLVLTSGASQSGAGNYLANIITATTAAGHKLEGLAGLDTLLGGAGDDTLLGGGDTDSMVGGLGNDKYQVDLASDVIVELFNEGIDSVDSRVNFYALSNNIENLTNGFTTGNQTGHGNALDNVLTGGTANDSLAGLDGNDTLTGGAGNDTLNGGNGNDSLSGGNDNDSLLGFDGNDTLLGGNGNDTLSGGNGNDTVSGEAGDDSLLGGAGDDSLTGAAGNDTLNGGSGLDTLRGGDGNDDYTGVEAADVVTEFGGQGYDRVFTGGSYTLGANLEYLELTSGASGTGNTLDNTIVGNSANNTLNGLTGADVLYGRGGNDNLYAGVDAVQDQFVFDTALNAATNVDTLFEADFGEDQVLLDNDIFTALLSTTATQDGTLGAGYYFEGAGLSGGGVGDTAGIYYNLSNGNLYYNPTAGVAGDSVLFAIVNGAPAALGSTDFTLFTDVG